MYLGTLRGSEKRAIRKNGTRPKVAALDETTWDLEQAVRETKKNFSTDLQLLMTETTNDPTLLKTLVSLERQQHELIPEENQIHKRKLLSRFGLVFIEDISQSDHHQPSAQRPLSHQQNDSNSTTFLVTADD